MKPIIVLLLIVLLTGCSNYNPQAAKTVCKKVTRCCQSVGLNQASCPDCVESGNGEDKSAQSEVPGSIYELNTLEILTR